MNNSPFRLKQQLSKAAALKKATRDKKSAMTKWGKYKKRTAQTANCPKGYDFDHSTGKCIPASKNRAKNSRSGFVKKKYKY